MADNSGGSNGTNNPIYTITVGGQGGGGNAGNGSITNIPTGNNGGWYTITTTSQQQQSQQIIPLSGDFMGPPVTENKKNSDGCVCKKCKEFFEYAESNQPDGSLICWACKHGY